jgi:hypothetical protein
VQTVANKIVCHSKKAEREKKNEDVDGAGRPTQGEASEDTESVRSRVHDGKEGGRVHSHSVWKSPQKASLDVHKLALARIVSDHHCPRLPCHSATHSLENITDGRVEDEAVSVGLSSAESCDGCTRVGADQSVGGLKPWTEAVKQVDKHRKPCKRENRRESPTVPAGAASAWLGVHGLSNVARSRSTVLGGISHEQHRHMAKPTAPATKTRFVMKGAVAMRGCVVPLHARSSASIDDS